MKRRILSGVLALCMLFSLTPVTALAEENQTSSSVSETANAPDEDKMPDDGENGGGDGTGGEQPASPDKETDKETGSETGNGEETGSQPSGETETDKKPGTGTGNGDGTGEETGNGEAGDETGKTTDTDGNTNEEPGGEENTGGTNTPDEEKTPDPNQPSSQPDSQPDSQPPAPNNAPVLLRAGERTEITVPYYPIPGETFLEDFLWDIFNYTNAGFKDNPGDYKLLVTESQDSAENSQRKLLNITSGYDVLLTGQTGNEILTSKAPTDAVEPAEGVTFRTNPLFVVESGGTLTISNLTLDADGRANLIVVEEGGTLILEDGAVLTNCVGSAIINYGTLEMRGGSITNSDAQQKQSYEGNGAVLNGPDATFTMTGGNITGNGYSATNDAERSISNDSGYAGGVTNLGTFTMTGGSISGNGAGCLSRAAGGVYNAGIFTLGGTASISQNTTVLASHVGGVYNAKDATFTLQENAVISENEAMQSGGGVYNAGTFNMNGGTISGHEVTQFGGGVYNAIEATFTMKGGTISGNTSRSASSTTALNVGTGGGVYNGGTFAMEGGTITGNAATKGGGIHSGNPLDENIVATFTMTGGTISNNTADANGGGLFVFTNSTAEIRRGSITGNTANAVNGGGFSGGGIYINQCEEDEDKNGTLFLYNVAIYGNTSGTKDYADGRKEGSGIAACPYSNVHVYMTDGGAVFGNSSADGSPQPQIFVDEPYDQYLNPDRVHAVQLSRYMLGGSAYNWTDAGGKALTDEQLRADEIAAYNTITESSDAAKAALAEAAVIISGNSSADRGGGIGCNGNLYIGTGPENILRIQKQVSGPASQQEFSFTLALKTGDVPYTGEFQLALNGGGAQSVQPNDQGQYTFTLPANGQAECLGLPTGTTYTVTEGAAGNCQTTVNGQSGNTADGSITENGIITLVFLNTYPQPDPQPGGGDEQPAPTPASTPAPQATPAPAAQPVAVAIPQTGDEMPVVPLVVVTAAAAAAFAALLVLRKRRHGRD